jgi:hypothetical protein
MVEEVGECVLNGDADGVFERVMLLVYVAIDLRKVQQSM